MATTMMMPMSSSSECRSSLPCGPRRTAPSDQAVAAAGRAADAGSGGERQLRRTDRPPDVVDHDEDTREVHAAADQPHHVLDVAGGNGLGEAVGEEALGRVFAPHQAFHDAGDPHRGDVEKDAGGRDPEVPLDQRVRVEALLPPEPGHHAVEHAEGHEADPAQRAGVDVGDGPVGVVRQRVDHADREHRAFEGRHAVEGERHDKHADTGSVGSLSQAPGSVIRPLIMPPQDGIQSMIEKIMPSVCVHSGRAV